MKKSNPAIYIKGYVYSQTKHLYKTHEDADVKIKELEAQGFKAAILATSNWLGRRYQIFAV